MSSCHYSIVTSAYQTAAFLEELLERIDLTMQQVEGDYEVICVDDRSLDNSWEVLKKVQLDKTYPLRLIRLAHNHGQHRALLCGLQAARATKAVVVLDSDLQNPPEEIPRLIEAFQEYHPQVVYGVAKEKRQASWRNLGSRILGRFLLREGALTPYASPYKLLSRKLVDQLITSRFEYVFLDAMISWYTKDVRMVEVIQKERIHGKSSYPLGKLLRMSMQIIINYTALPLRVMTYGGLIVALLCFGLGIYFIINKIFFAVPLGFTATIVIITFGLAIIIFSLGIIGEYIRRLYFAQLGKPSFHIQEISECI
ncbi:glycosyltransferase family 2 protein [Lewinella sp. LCG006]|uniref:glycosyltransferase family 2 protein n=1 Tax=Lewinella sp. LCG006 TaxID=3231911 RepID=UPI0034615E8A